MDSRLAKGILLPYFLESTSSSSTSNSDRETSNDCLDIHAVLMKLFDHFFYGLLLIVVCKSLTSALFFILTTTWWDNTDNKAFKISICRIIGAKGFSATCPWKTCTFESFAQLVWLPALRQTTRQPSLELFNLHFPVQRLILTCYF